MSQVTTHVLDTSIGKPAAGVAVTLYQSNAGIWEELGIALTNSDGRATGLLVNDLSLPYGVYKLGFGTGAYFSHHGIQAFYPSVEILFEITDGEHYHVPLLLSPFGYSTYRGS